MRKKMKTFERLPKALSCGLIEDTGRFLFRIFLDQHGITRVETPFVLIKSGESITAKLKDRLSEIIENNVEIGEPIFEFSYNTGNKRRKNFIPCIVFKIKTFGVLEVKNKLEYKWLKLEEVKKMRKIKESEWLNKI